MRLGVILLAWSVVCLLLAAGLPILEIGEESITADDAEGDVAYDVMTSHRSVGAIAFAALAVWGLLMVLEGRGANTLRRLFPWHSEVRATAVYAVAATIALVGLLEMGTVWGITAYESSVTAADMLMIEASASPAGLASTLIAAPLVLLMLFMTAYAATFAVYRGGGHRRELRMAKLSLAIVLLAMLGLVLLHVGRIVSIDADISYPRLVSGVVFNVHSEYTLGDIEVQALLVGGDGNVAALDDTLSTMSWALLATFVLGLSGAVGAAALGMRSLTRRVHLAAGMPFLAALTGLVAGIVGAMAVFLTPSIVEDLLFEMYLADMSIEFDVYVGVALVAGLVIALIVVLLTIPFALAARPSTLLIGLGLEAPPGVPQVVPVGMGLPSARPARGRGPMVPIVAVVLVLVLASGTWGYLTLSGAMKEAFGADEVVDISDLDEYSQTIGRGETLDDGEMTHFEALLDALQPPQGMDGDGVAVYFIDTIDVTLTWEDEPDMVRVIATWENQPDTFLLEVTDDSGLVSLSGQETNVHGQEGSIHLRWDGNGDYIAIGLRWTGGEWAPASSELDRRVEGGDLYWDDDVIALVTLVSTGDMTNPRRVMTYADDANDFHLRVAVTGRVYVLEP